MARPEPKYKQRKQQPYIWGEQSYSSNRGVRALWVGVISQALMDALYRGFGKEGLYHKHNAISWFQSKALKVKKIGRIKNWREHEYD